MPRNREPASILAETDGAVIGAATGMPLVHEDAALRDPFAETPYPLNAIYYIGELPFRGATGIAAWGSGCWPG